jgi:uncharacterized protein (TIGR02001 family)
MASTLCLSATSAFSESALDEENFSVNIALTSNYLFRGITLSSDDPVMSGGFDCRYEGFYAGTRGDLYCLYRN